MHHPASHRIELVGLAVAVDGGTPVEIIRQGAESLHCRRVTLGAAVLLDSLPGRFKFFTGIQAHGLDQVTVNVEMMPCPAPPVGKLFTDLIRIDRRIGQVIGQMRAVSFERLIDGCVLGRIERPAVSANAATHICWGRRPRPAGNSTAFDRHRSTGSA